MKKTFAFFILSLATSSAFATTSTYAIPCSSTDISNALQEFINEQPICFSPCEAAKTYKNIYEKGLSLVYESCSEKDPVAVLAIKDLNKALADSLVAIHAHCN